MFWPRKSAETRPFVVPRDVEALEAVLVGLSTGGHNLREASETIIKELAKVLNLAYAAWWNKMPNGDYELVAETGELALAIQSAAGHDARVRPATSGLLGEAISARRPVMTNEDPGAGATSPRWQAARQAGAGYAATVPLMENGQVVAVMSSSAAPSCRPSVGKNGRRSAASR
jgi:hypothetical protein